MEARAQVTNVRISPRKVKIVLDLIRNKPVDLAIAIVENTRKSACEPIAKLLKSAVANAENNFSMDKNNLVVSECYVCPGMILKRIRPAAKGAAHRIDKRTSHITVVLKEMDEEAEATMGQKVNPHGLRVGVIKDWDSKWFVKDNKFGDTLVSDYNIRKYLKKTLYAAGVSKITIERDPSRVRVYVHCAKPGMVIGKGGVELEKYRAATAKIAGTDSLVLNVVEVKNPDTNAQLVAENIALQLEKRTSFRRAMKQAISRAMKLGAKGIKTQCSGRLGGAEIARTEQYHEGTIPLQTLRADIDSGFAEANTTYGRIGIKVWIYGGEVLVSSAKAPRRREGGRK